MLQLKFSYFINLLLAVLIWSGAVGCQSGTKQKPEQPGGVNQPISDEDSLRKFIVFFGNSLTAGYGLEEGESFPALIQKKIDSLDLPYQVINAGVSGETSAGGLSRIDWILNQPMDIFVLELGANDVLRGFELSATRDNLASIIETVQKRNPEIKIILAGMKAPPNMGQKYSGDFENIFTELSKNKNTYLIPFLLEGVAGDPSLNLGDGMHPNPDGQKIVAENVWEILRQVL